MGSDRVRREVQLVCCVSVGHSSGDQAHDFQLRVCQRLPAVLRSLSRNEAAADAEAAQPDAYSTFVPRGAGLRIDLKGLSESRNGLFLGLVLGELAAEVFEGG